MKAETCLLLTFIIICFSIHTKPYLESPPKLLILIHLWYCSGFLCQNPIWYIFFNNCPISKIRKLFYSVWRAQSIYCLYIVSIHKIIFLCHKSTWHTWRIAIGYCRDVPAGNFLIGHQRVIMKIMTSSVNYVATTNLVVYTV